MTTVFLSGSRKISRINNEIRDRLKNIIEKKFLVVLGDANGADKVMQQFLAELQYRNVIIFCSGQNLRNNVGKWEVQHIAVDPGLKGREFYAAKDKKMADIADYGFVLWDGKSSGSIANVVELLKKNKRSLVYFAPGKQFYSISNAAELRMLFNKCDDEAIKNISKKINLIDSLHELESSKQVAFSF